MISVPNFVPQIEVGNTGTNLLVVIVPISFICILALSFQKFVEAENKPGLKCNLSVKLFLKTFHHMSIFKSKYFISGKKAFDTYH